MRKPRENLPLVAFFNGVGDGEPTHRENVFLWRLRSRGYEVLPRKTNWNSETYYEDELGTEVKNTEALLGLKKGGLVLLGYKEGYYRALNNYVELAGDHKDLWTVGFGVAQSNDNATPQVKAAIRHSQEIAIPNLLPADRARIVKTGNVFTAGLVLPNVIDRLIEPKS